MKKEENRFFSLPLQMRLRSLTRLTSLWQASCPSKYFTSASSSGVALAYDDHQSEVTDSRLAPLLVCHGMLGSRLNWNSIAKRIHATTGRRVVTVDARHGPTGRLSFIDVASFLQEPRRLSALHRDELQLYGRRPGRAGGQAWAGLGLPGRPQFSIIVYNI